MSSNKRKRRIRQIMASTGCNYTRAAEIDRRQQAHATSKGKRRSQEPTIREILQKLAPELNLRTNYPYAAIAQAAEAAGLFNRNMLADAFKRVDDVTRLNPSIAAAYGKMMASVDPAVFQPHTARIAQAAKAAGLFNHSTLADAFKLADVATRRTTLVDSINKMLTAEKTRQANYARLMTATVAAEQAARIAKIAEIAQPNLKIYNTVMKLDSMFKGFPPRPAN